jgi:DNA-directed RNA polymerase subunit RPC12/RpoP
MRLPYSKVYRAFPELDRFDDATCERYIRAARAAPRSWRSQVVRPLLWFIGGIAAFVASVWVSVSVFGAIFSLNTPRHEALMLAAMLLCAFAAPMIFLLYVRDMILRRRIAAQLGRTRCPACHYNLLGIPIHQEPEEGVICPECGFEILFSHISPATASAYRAATGLRDAAQPLPAKPLNPSSSTPPIAPPSRDQQSPE